MTVTIGSFSTNALTAQPYGYDGEARRGLTSRAFRISGLLTPSQWAALLTEYNSWRNTRINDQDTLLSKSVGTTVSLTSSSANGVSVTGLACWFTDAPSGEQLGAYVSATTVLVDAAEAVAALIREDELSRERQQAQEETAVDCAVIAARLQRQKDEADCELAALAGGLADDFAVQRFERQITEKTAENTAAVVYAEDVAGLELSGQVIEAEARAAVYSGGGASNLASLKAAEVDIEIAEVAARVTALGAALDDLKTSRSLLALYERYLTEDLPNFGTETIGPVTVTLLRPAETRSAGPSVSLTATGNPYISGPLAALTAKDIEGYTTSSVDAGALMSWYDGAVAGTPAPGSWFPTAAPTIRAEKVLVEGVVGTRYTINATLVQV